MLLVDLPVHRRVCTRCSGHSLLVVMMHLEVRRCVLVFFVMCTTDYILYHTVSTRALQVLPCPTLIPSTYTRTALVFPVNEGAVHL